MLSVPSLTFRGGCPGPVNKANTLGAPLEHLGVTREEVIAVGDGVLNVTMPKFGVAWGSKGHSQDSVTCADYVTASMKKMEVALAAVKTNIGRSACSRGALDLLNERARHALMGNLGIQYTYASDERVEATMPVDYRTRQPFPVFCMAVPPLPWQKPLPGLAP